MCVCVFCENNFFLDAFAGNVDTLLVEYNHFLCNHFLLGRKIALRRGVIEMKCAFSLKSSHEGTKTVSRSCCNMYIHPVCAHLCFELAVGINVTSVRGQFVCKESVIERKEFVKLCFVGK